VRFREEYSQNMVVRQRGDVVPNEWCERIQEVIT
jgi:hypothetical protein